MTEKRASGEAAPQQGRGLAANEARAVSDQQIPNRPIGWWLKEADARLDAAFDSALSPHGADRRRWQMLASLARSPRPRAEVVASLAPFDEPAALEQVVDELKRVGWVDESDGALRLTPAGAEKQASLEPLVEQVRRRVACILPEDDYVTLVGLLMRLVDGLPERSAPRIAPPRRVAR